jgi:adenine-specific DNA-methyltransferase
MQVDCPMEKVTQTTPNPLEERIEHLKALFPEAVQEGELDFAALRALLGDEAAPSRERFSFTWAGKHEAILSLQQRSRATLKPVREQSVNFDTTHNVFIEGENLEVLKLLYKSYFGRVKMIYIDPPYNTGKDFVYPDDYSDPLEHYLRITGQIDEEGNLQSNIADLNGKKHSRWLTMMYPRMFIAKQLLRDDGVIFITVDDTEYSNLRLLMDEIFGSENWIATIIWQKTDSPSRNDKGRPVSAYHDYILLYAKNKAVAKVAPQNKPEILEGYRIKLSDGRSARRRQLRKNGKNARREDRPTMWYELKAPDGTPVFPIAPEGWEGRWALSEETWYEREGQGLTEWIEREYGWTPYYLEVEPETPEIPWSTIWTDVDQNRQAKAEFTALLGSEVDFDNPKPTALMRRIVQMSTDDKDICLDFFAGSGTLAQGVIESNYEDGKDRRFIVVQMAQPTVYAEFPTVSSIAQERIRRTIARVQIDASGIDMGFRSYRLERSTMQALGPINSGISADEYLRQLTFWAANSLAEGWTVEDVIAEVALKEVGFGLTYQVEQVDSVTGNTVYQVMDPDKAQAFYICLDDKLSLEALAPLNLQKDDLFIFRDSAIDDTTIANLALQCRVKAI